MTDFFVSYSRRNIEIVREFVTAVEQTGCTVWVDWAGIEYSTHWWEEICVGIDSADCVLFLITPQSLNSIYCHRELAHAREHGKRLLPVLIEPVDSAQMQKLWKENPAMQGAEVLLSQNWQALFETQYVDYAQTEGTQQLAQLVQAALRIDHKRTQMHTRLLLRIRDWETRGRPPAALLRGEELVDYEHWLAEKTDKQPVPTPEQQSYIELSRHYEDEQARLNAARDIQRRRFRNASLLAGTVGTLALLAAAAALPLGINGQAQAENSRATIGVIGATLQQIEATLTPAARTVGAAETSVAAIIPTITAAAPIINRIGQNESERLSIIAADGSGDRAILVALHALRRSYNPESDALIAADALSLNELALQASYPEDLSSTRRSSSTQAISPDRRVRINVTDLGLEFRQNSTGDLIRRSPVNTVPGSIAFHPDSTLFATADAEGIIRIWSVETGTALRVITTDGAVADLSISPDGTLLAAAQPEGLRIFNFETGRIVHRLDTDNGFTALEFIDSATLLLGSDRLPGGMYDGVLAYRWQDGYVERQFGLQVEQASDLTLSEDRQMLTIGQNQRWRLDGTYPVGTALNHGGRVTTFAVSADESRLAVEIDDQSVVVWDLTAGQFHVVPDLPSSALELALNPSGDEMVVAARVGSGRGLLWLYDIPSRQVITEIPLDISPSAVWYTQDGTHIVLQSRTPQVQAWRRVDLSLADPTTLGFNLDTLSIPENSTAYALSEDGQWFARSTTANTTEVWSTTQGSLIQTLPGQIPDGARGFTGSHLTLRNNGTTSLYDTSSWQMVRTVSGNVLIGVSPERDRIAIARGSAISFIPYSYTETMDFVCRLRRELGMLAELTPDERSQFNISASATICFNGPGEGPTAVLTPTLSATPTLSSNNVIATSTRQVQIQSTAIAATTQAVQIIDREATRLASAATVRGSTGP